MDEEGVQDTTQLMLQQKKGIKQVSQRNHKKGGQAGASCRSFHLAEVVHCLKGVCELFTAAECALLDQLQG